MHRRASLASCLVLLAACDVPSGIPNWETTWNVPSQSLTVGIGQVLPSGVTVSPDGGAFLVSLAPVTVTERLGDDCAPCAALAGRMAPKPAFQARMSVAASLPGDVQGGMLAAGTRLELRIVNGNTFDPLRPAAGVTGWMTLVVRNGAMVLARDSVNGAAVALPAGGQLVRSITLGGGAVTGVVTVDVIVDSPEGDALLLEPSRTVQITATPSPLRVTQASLAVRGAQVSQSTDVDLDVSTALGDRVRGGRLLVAVRDPFAVRGALAVRLAAPGAAPLLKAVDLAGGDRSYAIDFTRDELRALLGRTVTITFSGPVSTAGMLTVTPSQTITIGTRFELVLSTND